MAKNIALMEEKISKGEKRYKKQKERLDEMDLALA